MKNLRDFIVGFLGLTVILVVAIFGGAIIFSYPLKWLWNWLFVDLFNFPRIDFWKAFGLLLISGLLFRSYHGNGKSNS
jgi:hypothetical protein